MITQLYTNTFKPHPERMPRPYCKKLFDYQLYKKIHRTRNTVVLPIKKRMEIISEQEDNENVVISYIMQRLINQECFLLFNTAALITTLCLMVVSCNRILTISVAKSLNATSNLQVAAAVASLPEHQVSHV